VSTENKIETWEQIQTMGGYWGQRPMSNLSYYTSRGRIVFSLAIG
jgi:hypothetical protein